MHCWLWALVALGCHRGPRDTDGADDTDVAGGDTAPVSDDDSGADTDGPWTESYVQIPCDVAGDEGLAVRVRIPDVARYGDAEPVVLSVDSVFYSGFDDVVAPEALLEGGGTIVQYLDPGRTEHGHHSGGDATDTGAARLAALTCVARWIDAGGGDYAFSGPKIVTGLSYGGNAVLIATIGDDLPFDGVVLWESPLIDQLITSEITSGGVRDPSFVEGTCTLDGGCPFPGRTPELRWDGSSLYRDLDRDGAYAATDVQYKPAEDESGKCPYGYWSTAMIGEVLSTPATVFDGPIPDGFPRVDAALDYWSYRDARGVLKQVRDAGDHHRFLYVATKIDHVQPVHEHTRLAEEGLSHASFFRLDPDASYVAAVGGPEVVEFPAGTVVDDPKTLDTTLPETDDGWMVGAAELEMADRAWTDTWDADLDGVLVP